MSSLPTRRPRRPHPIPVSTLYVPETPLVSSFSTVPWTGGLRLPGPSKAPPLPPLHLLMFYFKFNSRVFLNCTMVLLSVAPLTHSSIPFRRDSYPVPFVDLFSPASSLLRRLNPPQVHLSGTVRPLGEPRLLDFLPTHRPRPSCPQPVLFLPPPSVWMSRKTPSNS